ncbi:MAG: 50S ribosomal protein L25/general stress protein Ctc [Flavobacteriaceae bacterium]|jgi:large subunit ribosomal protein L25|nr:50S ribosomal protein L25/general stress protein Ctc [Flavobacteriaceae bacterium]MDG2290666.1 50S ribosomal protein L25/general stress protein Ctc [Flavobacteriaceae bacterium]
MKSITINGSKRESVGKVATKALRNAGEVPCVLYGGEAPVHFAADERAFAKLVYTPNAHTVVIDLGDNGTFNAILQDIQFHPVSDKILHIDFYQLFDDKEVSMNIPVVIKGAAPGVLNSGGVLSRNKRKLRVRALPADLPDTIEADISELELGDKLYVTEVADEKFKFLHPDNTVVCQVRTSRVSLQIEDEVEGAEEGAEGAEGAEEGAEGSTEGGASAEE